MSTVILIFFTQAAPSWKRNLQTDRDCADLHIFTARTVQRPTVTRSLDSTTTRWCALFSDALLAHSWVSLHSNDLWTFH